ncbi:hypothetical protein NP493_1438g00007 [Ridgeia piscesae]|uniref:EGF-like domain-containing protein n=1 Tax=Ridgeia piscesae TaxID=27915 RepID=A0AAD9K320_RIDPI|nr:hypothetical protein NP493_1438g00007 [Ridgeia piscesae]
MTGFEGSTCNIDTIECHSNPCANGGSCIQDEKSYECKCEPRFYGSNCETVVPASDVKRVNIQLSLKSEQFSETLTDPKSEAHKQLKKTVVAALKRVLDKKLKGGYRIVDVTFSEGSVVVKYVLEMKKDNTVEAETVVSDEIQNNGGKFAGFKVDPDSVKVQEKTTVRYYGQFRVPSLEYRKVWSDNGTPEYAELAGEVKQEVR